MDLIGPWTLQVRGNPYEFEALTVIDTVTNLVKSSESMTKGHKL
jgi:hypothetical protein